MKLKLFVALIEKLLRMPEHGDEHRADMYLPTWLLAFGIALVIGAIILTVLFVFTLEIALVIAAIVCLLLSCGAVLCWRNQMIRIIDEETFEYTTWLGHKKVYAFADIKMLKRNSDSLTLYVGNGKVHIESCAIMSDRLANQIDAALSKSTKG